MATLVPMPADVIIDMGLAPRKWWEFVGYAFRNEWKRRRRNPLASLRRAIRTVNHGVRHNGKEYRCCYRLRWLEA